MSTLHYVAILLVVLLLAGLSGWWLAEMRKRPTTVTPTDAAHFDYFLTNFETTVLDTAGKPTYIVKAAHMEHYPTGDRMLLTQPHFTFLEAANRWQTQSLQAEVYVDERQILLSGNVVLTQHVPDRAVATLTTERLQVDAEAQTAETDSEVKILSGKDTITAKGLKANLAKGQLELLSDVRGQYHLPPNH